MELLENATASSNQCRQSFDGLHADSVMGNASSTVFEDVAHASSWTLDTKLIPAVIIDGSIKRAKCSNSFESCSIASDKLEQPCSETTVSRPEPATNFDARVQTPSENFNNVSSCEMKASPTSVSGSDPEYYATPDSPAYCPKSPSYSPKSLYSPKLSCAQISPIYSPAPQTILIPALSDYSPCYPTSRMVASLPSSSEACCQPFRDKLGNSRVTCDSEKSQLDRSQSCDSSKSTLKSPSNSFCNESPTRDFPQSYPGDSQAATSSSTKFFDSPSPKSPSYFPTSSPVYSSAKPDCTSNSPHYSPTSPGDWPTSESPMDIPQSPRYSPTSPNRPPGDSPDALDSPTWSPTAPSYGPTSPRYSPTNSPEKDCTSNSQHYSPASPGYWPTSPLYIPQSPSYSPTSPTDPPGDSPTRSPMAPSYGPTSPRYSPTNSPEKTRYSPISPDPPPGASRFIWSSASPSYGPTSPMYLPMASRDFSESRNSSQAPPFYYTPTNTPYVPVAPTWSGLHPQRGYSPAEPILLPTDPIYIQFPIPVLSHHWEACYVPGVKFTPTGRPCDGKHSVAAASCCADDDLANGETAEFDSKVVDEIVLDGNSAEAAANSTANKEKEGKSKKRQFQRFHQMSGKNAKFEGPKFGVAQLQVDDLEVDDDEETDEECNVFTKPLRKKQKVDVVVIEECGIESVEGENLFKSEYDESKGKAGEEQKS
ncbi:hypothetical protein BDR26DRAFT_871325 [Obelidium mucronatum]|nr:hypothetical protein BDR26DRAFT_871325 [Obelidium mucronatum]